MVLGLIASSLSASLLAAICLQTRQESWRTRRRSPARCSSSSGCRLPARRPAAALQALGSLTPLTWWIEGVRHALFPGGVSSVGGAGFALRGPGRTGRAGPAEIVFALLVTGAVVTLAATRRLQAERAPGQGSWAARPDDGLVS